MTWATRRCIMPAARQLCPCRCTGRPMVCLLEANSPPGEAERARCCTLPTNLKRRDPGAVVAPQFLLNDVIRPYGRPCVCALSGHPLQFVISTSFTLHSHLAAVQGLTHNILWLVKRKWALLESNPSGITSRELIGKMSEGAAVDTLLPLLLDRFPYASKNS